MRPLSSLGIGLGLVSGCLLLALIAELYYMFWWKRRIPNREIEDDHSSPARELLYLFCWKRPSSLSSTALNHQELCSSAMIADESGDGHLEFQPNSGKDLLLRSFEGEDSMEEELKRLHGLSGPPRFLFTIKEETKEDLESEDGRSRGGKSRKSSRGGSLGDLLLSAESPFLTPLSSPPFFTPPLTPLDCYRQNGFNPLFESLKEEDFSRMRSTSPPPKFKFLKDAEDKLYRRTLMEEALRVHRNGGDVARKPNSLVAAASPPPIGSEEEDGSYITIIIGKNRERGQQHQHHSTSSQVIPLASSPSNIRPAAHGKPVSNLSPKR